MFSCSDEWSFVVDKERCGGMVTLARNYYSVGAAQGLGVWEHYGIYRN